MINANQKYLVLAVPIDSKRKAMKVDGLVREADDASVCQISLRNNCQKTQ